MDSTKKMLKKARSFRDRIRRGTLTRGFTRAESPIKVLPPNGPLSPTVPAELGAAGSYPGGAAAATDLHDQSAAAAAVVAAASVGNSSGGSSDPSSTAAAESPAAEKISSEYRKVYQAIKFMLYAVEKVNLVMLPGSATITLETILELIATVTTVLASHDESNLISTHLKRVYNALADLIQWSDTVTLSPSSSAPGSVASPAAPLPSSGPTGNPAAAASSSGAAKQKQIDSDSARLVISALHDSVKDLADLATSKAMQLSLPDSGTGSSYSMTTLPKGALKKSSSVNISDKVKRNSLPEIPLTPREKTILKETSYGAFDNPLLGHGEPATPSKVQEPGPPPKPFLPPDFDLHAALPSLALATGPADGSGPPPLPDKRRNRLCSYDDAVADPEEAGIVMDGGGGSSSKLSQILQPHGALPSAMPASPNSARSSMSSGDDLLNGGSTSGGRSCNRYSSGDELEEARHGYYPSGSIGVAAGSQYRYHEVVLRHGLGVGRAIRLPDDELREESRHRRANSDYDNVDVDEEDVSQQSSTYRDIGHSRSAAAVASRMFVYPDMHATAGSSCTAGGGSESLGFARRGVADWPHTAGSGIGGVAASSQMTFERAWIHQGHQLLGSGGFVKSVSASDAFVSGSSSSIGYHRSMGGITLIETSSSAGSQEHPLNPPPLPPKRRHVESYMNVFGPYSMNQLDYSPPSAASLVHSRRFYQHVQELHQRELFNTRSATISSSLVSSPLLTPLPPTTTLYLDTAGSSAAVGAVIASPDGRSLAVLPSKQQSQAPPSSSSGDPGMRLATQIAITEPTASAALVAVNSPAPLALLPQPLGGHLIASHSRQSSLSPASSPKSTSRAEAVEGDVAETNPLDSLDVSPFLIREKQSSSGSRQSLPELKGGPVDALVVYATYCPKQDELPDGKGCEQLHCSDHPDFMYQEAFLTTYRTFVSPGELIDKLLYRYNKFALASDDSRRRASRSAFGLLVRVVDELSAAELTDNINQLLLQLVCSLVREGELTLARILRKKVLEKVDPTQRPVDGIYHIVQLKPTKPLTLLDFSAQAIAEQMTLMDKEFYERLDIAELLIWSKSQDEERCVNLVHFTAHFNKMSWWCRTLILLADDPALREKYFLKFVKVLKHLRKLNNFNSFLALLSALDSAPVRRLDWPRQATEVIKEFSVLIDCSSSFKAYRTTLAETDPPCIPYIGIILQDMTFIRLGSMPLLPDGKINFVMRWQLFNVLECLRRFRKPDYGFKKDPKVVQFLNNFDDCVTSDDDLWERSQLLKPTR